MFFVYRFIDRSNNIIYVGKSKLNLVKRFKQHHHLPDNCYAMVYKIEYIVCQTEADMSIKEIFYINKYRKDENFFNLLDISETPVNVEFNDQWKQYVGSLPARFSNSINFIHGYLDSKNITHYNLDGSISKRTTHKKTGDPSKVFAFTAQEANLIVDYFIDQIFRANSKYQEQIDFRNLLLFVLGVSIPIRSGNLLQLKYADLFDENNTVKSYNLQLNRASKYQTINIPLPDDVRELLSSYAQRYQLSYKEHGNDYIFFSREKNKREMLTAQMCIYILNKAAQECHIFKNIGGESLRKTYALNIYHKSTNYLEAIFFLETIWGQDGRFLNYLDLVDEEINWDYYFSKHFSIFNLDISKLQQLPIRN